MSWILKHSKIAIIIVRQKKRIPRIESITAKRKRSIVIVIVIVEKFNFLEYRILIEHVV